MLCPELRATFLLHSFSTTELPAIFYCNLFPLQNCFQLFIAFCVHHRIAQNFFITSCVHHRIAQNFFLVHRMSITELRKTVLLHPVSTTKLRNLCYCILWPPQNCAQLFLHSVSNTELLAFLIACCCHPRYCGKLFSQPVSPPLMSNTPIIASNFIFSVSCACVRDRIGRNNSGSEMTE